MRTCLERSLCAGLPQFPFSVLSLSLVYTRAAASLRLPAPPQPPLKARAMFLVSPSCLPRLRFLESF